MAAAPVVLAAASAAAAAATPAAMCWGVPGVRGNMQQDRLLRVLAEAAPAVAAVLPLVHPHVAALARSEPHLATLFV